MSPRIGTLCDAVPEMSTPATLHDIRLAIIGTGVMAEAILSGLLRESLIDPDKVVASHPRAERREQVRKRHGVHVTDNNLAAATDADILILAVKPQMLTAIAPELRRKLDQQQIVVSILAGATTKVLAESLDHTALVRAMPNTPAQIGEGVTVWYGTAAVHAADRGRIKTLLSALGREVEVHDEGQLAMATALSGTGPSYVFLIIEALTDAGVHLGFPRHIAHDLVVDTIVGSGLFARSSGRHSAELRNMVTSPGGTSAEALYELEAGRLRTVITDAVWAAYARTLELEARLEGRDPPPGTGRRPRG